MQMAIDDALADQMTAHHALLSRWAEKINLTAIKDPVRAAELHGLDSLLFAELIDPSEESKTVDVGSGAGFPGIVVLLARPKLRMTLMEPSRKRASFLRVALAELHRPDVSVIEARLEVGSKGEPWPADLILSRATVPPRDLIVRASRVLSPRGRLLMTQGAGAIELDELRSRASAAGFAHDVRLERVLPGGVMRRLDSLVRGPGQQSDPPLAA
jgi:16S rRNA (guanine527-N7)-methyltransferase